MFLFFVSVPDYLAKTPLLDDLWPIVSLVFFMAFIFSFFGSSRENRKEFFLVLLSFSMMGIVVGYLTGVSISPVVTALVPSSISFIGGLLIFLIGKNNSSRAIASLSMFLFCLLLFIGMEWGSKAKECALAENEKRKNVLNQINSGLELQN